MYKLQTHLNLNIIICNLFEEVLNLKFEMTDIELCVLIDLVCAGNWVINGCRKPDELIQPYREMTEMIAKRYKEQKNLSEDLDIDAVEDRLTLFFDFYASHTARITFANLLAVQNYGADEYRHAKAAEIYADELRENGLKNVRIEISGMDERLKKTSAL